MDIDSSQADSLPRRQGALADALFDMLRPDRLTAVVDVGANAMLNDPPYKRMLKLGVCSVTGFEPQEIPLSELNRNKGPRERYFPYAIGNGEEGTFHLCKARPMSSLLAPDPDHLALFNEFPKMGTVDRQIRISTRRLDDIDEIEDVDFLKIDIQGAELEVFKSGRNKLAKTVAVQTEVSFVSLYRDQPAFGTVDLSLREMGFIPHCLAELKRWSIVPLVFGDTRTPGNQLLEADLVYVRDFLRPENLSGEQWKHLALIAHHCYASFDLALRAIISAERLGALSNDVPERYLNLLQTLVRASGARPVDRELPLRGGQTSPA
jgi:FkbM family methyltransferase